MRETCEFGKHMDDMKSRGIVFEPIENAAGIKGRWSKLFASSLSKEEKQDIYYDQYRWHIFSFERVKCLSGEEARQAFDACQKQKVYQFFQHSRAGFCIENAHLLKAEDLDYGNLIPWSDTYLFDPEGKWTYVRTHESMCGPYFYEKNS
ncbi:MAG: DUF4275 family protein [Firmicutes bacterium]|nr:DUF4275 family protein [Bacillota bacterium]